MTQSLGIPNSFKWHAVQGFAIFTPTLLLKQGTYVGEKGILGFAFLKFAV